MLGILPDDAHEAVGEHLTTKEYAALRLVLRDLKWTTRRVFLHGGPRVFPPRVRGTCLQCRARALTHLLWMDGYEREAIPWCELHAPTEMLHNVELFCTRACQI